MAPCILSQAKAKVRKPAPFRETDRLGPNLTSFVLGVLQSLISSRLQTSPDCVSFVFVRCVAVSFCWTALNGFAFWLPLRRSVYRMLELAFELLARALPEQGGAETADTWVFL